ncbi:MAG: cell division protein FtsI (penicillin-binding protein 3) [Sphingobacteriales bacterium]|jgi:cell division protein FtsI (penicillin-binding protein 3)
MSIRKNILIRVYLAFTILLIMAGGIMFQVIKIQAVHGDDLQHLADSASKALVNVEAIRGNIYASDGSLLATSLPSYEIHLDLNTSSITDEIFYENIDSLAYCLSRFYKDKSTEGYKRELISARKNGSRYHLIQRKATYPELKELKTFPLFRKGRYKGGFIVEQKNKRVKPFRALAARTIGYKREDFRVGLEGAFDDYLGGLSGKRLMQKVSGGHWLPINDKEEIEPKDGLDIITSIDVNIQDVAHKALQTQLQIHDADHGCVILMEVSTGEIKAIANLTRMSPGVYAEAYNYAVGESTEPGSTFKLASIIAALEDGYIELEDSIATGNGEIEFYDLTLKDTREGGWGTITVQRAFEVSSNVAIAKIIEDNYKSKPQKFVDHLYRMKLNEPLDLKIVGEGEPRIKTPDDEYWSGVSLPYMSVGYEVTMTPLQMLTFYNAIANNGKMISPVFVKEIKERGKSISTPKTRVINDKICSNKTLKDVQLLLEGVVERGTAGNLSNTVYKIAGKTGTAQIAEGRSGYKTKIAYQASFAGYFPADNPKYSCIVVVTAPSKSVYYGNLVAGPIFREISDKVYSSRFDMHEDFRYQLETEKSKSPIAKRGAAKDTKIVYEALKIPYVGVQNEGFVRPYRADSVIELRDHDVIAGLVPNVMGMGLKDALYLLENQGLVVNVNGVGRVIRQSMPMGMRANKGESIYIDLEL